MWLLRTRGSWHSDKFENGKTSHKHVFIYNLFMYRDVAQLFREKKKEKSLAQKSTD